MDDAVKPKRRYVSKHRAVQAADTRDRSVMAARQQFIVAGWHGTTIAAIARAAGVSTETIYSIFGTKHALLRAAVESAVRRDHPELALLQQKGPRSVAAAREHHTQIALFARDVSQVLGNVADLMAVVRTAAATDSDLKTLYRELHDGRRRNLAIVAQALLAKGPLRNDMGAEAATATIWRLASPELFLLLTQIEGKTRDEYAEWLTDQLARSLLDQTRDDEC